MTQCGCWRLSSNFLRGVFKQRIPRHPAARSIRNDPLKGTALNISILVQFFCPKSLSLLGGNCESPVSYSALRWRKLTFPPLPSPCPRPAPTLPPPCQCWFWYPNQNECLQGWSWPRLFEARLRCCPESSLRALRAVQEEDRTDVSA